jgi:hypothetical protein
MARAADDDDFVFETFSSDDDDGAVASRPQALRKAKAHVRAQALKMCKTTKKERCLVHGCSRPRASGVCCRYHQLVARKRALWKETENAIGAAKRRGDPRAVATAREQAEIAKSDYERVYSGAVARMKGNRQKRLSAAAVAARMVAQQPQPRVVHVAPGSPAMPAQPVALPRPWTVKDDTAGPSTVAGEQDQDVARLAAETKRLQLGATRAHPIVIPPSWGSSDDESDDGSDDSGRVKPLFTPPSVVPPQAWPIREFCITPHLLCGADYNAALDLARRNGDTDEQLRSLEARLQPALDRFDQIRLYGAGYTLFEFTASPAKTRKALEKIQRDRREQHQE